MNHYKHILILILLLTACEEMPDFSQNPFEAPEDEQIPEIVFLDEFITGNTATLNWSGNSFALGFSYKLEIMDEEVASFQDVLYWTDWNTDSSVTLEYLDDGNYRFNVRTHFNFEKEDEKSIEFTIDAVPENSVRISPLMQEIEIGGPNTVEFSIFIEEVQNVSGIEIECHFDADIINPDGYNWGTIISYYSNNSGYEYIVPAPENNDGNVIITAAFGGDGFSGTGSLITLSFELNSGPDGFPNWEQTEFLIYYAHLFNSNGDLQTNPMSLVNGIIRAKHD